VDARLAPPPDDDLTADLVTPGFEPVTGGKIRVESKEDIRKRLGQSTDYDDAVARAKWIDNDERDRPEPAGPVLPPVAYAGTGGW